MKTKDQILRNISKCKLSPNDWNETRIYFTEKYGRGVVKPQNPKHPATFSWLLEWESGGFGAGDMVLWHGNWCVVSYQVPDGLFLCAIKTSDTFITYEKPKMVDVNEVSVLQPDLQLKFRDFINSSGYTVNARVGLLVEKSPIQTNKLYSFMLENAQYVGAVKEFDKNTVTFWFRYDGAQLVNDNTIVSRNNVDAMLNLEAEKVFNADMVDKYHMKWIKRESRFEHCLNPVEKGRMYYYVNEWFNVMSVSERNTVTSAKHREVFNYFSDYETARQFAAKLRSLAKEMQPLSQAAAPFHK